MGHWHHRHSGVRPSPGTSIHATAPAWVGPHARRGGGVGAPPGKWASPTMPQPATREGERMAVSAYVLIQTEVGKAAQVAEEVAKIDGVVSAEDGTGPYDCI